MRRHGGPAGLLLPGLLILAAACAPGSERGGPGVPESGCVPLRGPTDLPEALRESSGVAVSLRHPDLLWTHNDAGSVLFGIDREGRELARFPLPTELRDWEDIAVASCGRGGSCLWAADTGDNYEERPTLKLARFPEPSPTAEGLDTADVFPFLLPQGPRDIEALLVLPGERILLVTKGRNHPVTVYRYPPPLRGDTVTLEEVQRLSVGPRVFPRQVTGGAVSPRGGVVALRTYTSLQLYRVEGDTLQPVAGGPMSLGGVAEPQGEGVGLGLDGEVVLTSEGGPGGGPGRVAAFRCALGEG